MSQRLIEDYEKGFKKKFQTKSRSKLFQVSEIKPKQFFWGKKKKLIIIKIAVWNCVKMVPLGKLFDIHGLAVVLLY